MCVCVCACVCALCVCLCVCVRVCVCVCVCNPSQLPCYTNLLSALTISVEPANVKQVCN